MDTRKQFGIARGNAGGLDIEGAIAEGIRGAVGRRLAGARPTAKRTATGDATARERANAIAKGHEAREISERVNASWNAPDAVAARARRDAESLLEMATKTDRPDLAAKARAQLARLDGKQVSDGTTTARIRRGSRQVAERRALEQAAERFEAAGVEMAALTPQELAEAGSDPQAIRRARAEKTWAENLKAAAIAGATGGK